MKGPKKGIKVIQKQNDELQFGAKKGGVDDFIEAEFSKIQKIKNPDGSEDISGQILDQNYGYGGNSNFQGSPEIGAIVYTGGSNAGYKPKEKLTLKPFDIKKGGLKNIGSKPVIAGGAI